MKKSFLVAVIVLALSVGAFAFQNEPDGFRGLKWGDPPTEDMDYLRTREFDIKIYRGLDDKMQIGEAKLKDICYLFYEGRFMAVEISPEWSDYDALKDVVMLKFGDGVVTKEYGLTVQILWSGDTATIALVNSPRDGIQLLLIYSIEIWKEKEEEFPRKKEEAEQKKEEERQKAAEKGLDDF